jgi:hypothetical protein
MTHPLSGDHVTQWWWIIFNESMKNHPSLSKQNTIHKPLPYLGYMRIFVQEIPTEVHYRYLAMVGFESNSNGEILMNKRDAEAYLHFQESIKES